MKVAISCDGNEVSGHFGRCEKYIIFEVENGKLKSKIELANPGHKPFFLPNFLKEHGVQKIICQGIGPRAVDLFKQLGIEVISGVSGNIDEVVKQYINGTLKSGISTCEHTKEL